MPGLLWWRLEPVMDQRSVRYLPFALEPNRNGRWPTSRRSDRLGLRPELRLSRLAEVEGEGDQGLVGALGRGDADRAAVEGSAGTPPGDVEFVVHRVVGDTQQRAAALDPGDDYRPAGQAAQEVER